VRWLDGTDARPLVLQFADDHHIFHEDVKPGDLTGQLPTRSLSSSKKFWTRMRSVREASSLIRSITTGSPSAKSADAMARMGRTHAYMGGGGPADDPCLTRLDRPLTLSNTRSCAGGPTWRRHDSSGGG